MFRSWGGPLWRASTRGCQVTEKPSYFGMLNAIANAERQGYEYLNAWCERATDPDLKATLTTVATREHEHSLAFAKRIDELGFELEVGDVLDFTKQMEIVTSDCSDYEKAEALGLFERKVDTGERDIFAGLFDDKTIDIQTGALLGRYIAEERDSGRMIVACAQALKARHGRRRRGVGPVGRFWTRRSTRCVPPSSASPSSSRRRSRRRTARKRRRPRPERPRLDVDPRDDRGIGHTCVSPRLA